MSGGRDSEPGSADLAATEEMPSAGSLSSRRKLQPAGASGSGGVPAPRPSEPVQLARGESSGESQAAYATGPKNIPPSRHNLGSDPAPAVIVEGAQAHTYEPLDVPPAAPSQGGLYMAAPQPAVPPAPAIPQFVSPPPKMRARTRSDTVLITMPGRTGPSSKEKMLAFVVMLVIVVLLGVVFLLFSSLRAQGMAVPEPKPSSAAVAAPVPAPVPTKTVEPAPEPPPVAVVAAPALVDAGAKKPSKH